MDIFSIFKFIGGLAFFLYGIMAMSQGLENIAGGKLERLLKKATSNPIKSFTLGAFITALIQSSSAITVMLIGLVNSGIMNLSQTVSVIIGANLGTTITAWILSLTSIKGSENLFILSLLNPESFSPILAFVGICLIMKAKNKRKKNLGFVFMGFAILIFGMSTMTITMAPLANTPSFQNILINFKNPFLSLCSGLIVTALIQSSSASIGILQALSINANISYQIAIPIILGQNLGTCISAIFASVGVNINAKRVAGVHIIYNILSVLICFPAFLILTSFFEIKLLQNNITPFGIALFHTGYNVLTAFMLFPFCKLIEKLSIKYIKNKDKSPDVETVFLDRRLLLTPTFATSECFRKTLEMGELISTNLQDASESLFHYNEQKIQKMLENEVKIDNYEDKLNSFLLKLSSKSLTEENSNKVSQLLLSISDFERIGDHAINVTNIAKNFNELQYKLSNEACKEIKTLFSAIAEIFLISFTSYTNNDLILAKKVDPLEEAIKKGIRSAKNNHIQRLKAGNCTAEASFLFSDLLNELLRIAGHCGNIAISVIQLFSHKIFKHEYNHRDKTDDKEYSSYYENYKSKYKINKNQVVDTYKTLR